MENGTLRRWWRNLLPFTGWKELRPCPPVDFFWKRHSTSYNWNQWGRLLWHMQSFQTNVINKNFSSTAVCFSWMLIDDARRRLCLALATGIPSLFHPVARQVSSVFQLLSTDRAVTEALCIRHRILGVETRKYPGCLSRSCICNCPWHHSPQLYWSYSLKYQAKKCTRSIQGKL